MKKFKTGKLWALISAAMACIMVFSLAACTDPDDGKDVALILSATTAQVEVGKTTTVSVTSATTESIVWTSDKTDIATVAGSSAGNKLCTITGVKEGTAKITAKAGEKTATCTVTVKPAQSVTPDVETVTIAGAATQYICGTDGTLTLSATASKDSAISWESSAPAVATVDGGVVTAVAAGETIITAKVSDEIKATVTVKVLEGTALTQTGDHPAGWSYYYGEGDINLSNVKYYEEANEVHLTYKATWGPGYGAQIRYNDKYTGVLHNLSLTISSPVAGKILVNGKEVDLTVGDNPITAENYSEDALYVQFGIGAWGEGTSIVVAEEPVTFVLKNIQITSDATVDLVAPAFSIDATTKVITINDTANATVAEKTYQLGLFADENATEPTKTLTVVSGEAVNLSDVATGNYVTRIKVISLHAFHSGWSSEYETLNWSNANTPLSYNTHEAGKWSYWIEVANEGVAMTPNGDIVIKNLNAPVGEGLWYNTQVFFSPEEGKTITGISFTITADQAGYITVENENPSGVFELTAVAGEENTYSTAEPVSVTGLNVAPNAWVKIFMCGWNNTNQRLNGNITISNIVITYAS